MKYIQSIFILPLLLLPLSCSAESKTIPSHKTVTKLVNHFFPNNNNSIEYKTGDFNGDGLNDIAVLFTPKEKPIETKQLKTLTPWVYPTTKPSAKYRRSLVIFNKTKSEWISGSTQVFVLLDTNGVLETPSFQLLITNKNDKDYASHATIFPIKTKNDLIILPTEAGIDTYIYWDKDTYKLFEPEEAP